ncbi:hypothetical protein [Floccifex sp.]|uniref:hypothetical protein n=1 Tax=Floccifex sp. TaxID=2815810 RepID=UPI002A74B994|nr:hypothetical protein [Floccifex sp.]MDD7282192.1 hypothetical protein [Erysipelotrichaceae bacterium]MDY2958421.1 hypothetical protein [Floccifex sp.]
MEPKEWMMNKQTVLKNQKLELLKKQAEKEENELCNSLSENEVFDYMVSKLNYCRRKEVFSCQDLNVNIRCGDICYIDFGHSYLFEIGYLHFGLILSIQRGKVFVVPITGANSKVIYGKDHIMQLGKIEGMSKVSACYLNDSKWINSSRIIDVKAHIPVDSPLFLAIKQRIHEGIG